MTMTRVELSDSELRFLRAAMLEWSGSSAPTDGLALALGFADADSLSRQTWTLWQRIERAEELSAGEWRRVLLAAEVVFVSDVVGSGLDWSVTTGITDAQALATLRGLQGKLPRRRGNGRFTVLDGGEVAVADPERTD